MTDEDVQELIDEHGEEVLDEFIGEVIDDARFTAIYSFLIGVMVTVLIAVYTDGASIVIPGGLTAGLVLFAYMDRNFLAFGRRDIG